jgi:hypothetical protein
MRRLGRLLLLTLLALPACTETTSPPAASGAAPAAQPADPSLAARCTELGAIYDRYNTRRSEGSGGPDLERLGAGLDCQRGRYAQGIATLEKLLQRSRTPYPPA